MNSLSRRVDRIEERLEPDGGPGLRWPNGDGTFLEVPGCRSLNDPCIALGIAKGTPDGADDDDRIRRNPTL